MSSPPTMGIGTSSSSSGASAPRANAYAVNRDASELRRSPARKAPASAQPGPMHVIYTSVDTGFRGPSGPRTVGEPATDGHGPAHGRERKRPRTGPAGAVMQTALARIPALTCHFRMPALCRRRPRHEVLLGVLGAEGLGDALVGCGGLAVDAVGVDLEQDRDAVPVWVR